MIACVLPLGGISSWNVTMPWIMSLMATFSNFESAYEELFINFDKSCIVIKFAEISSSIGTKPSVKNLSYDSLWWLRRFWLIVVCLQNAMYKNAASVLFS